VKEQMSVNEDEVEFFAAKIIDFGTDLL